jgi:transposase
MGEIDGGSPRVDDADQARRTGDSSIAKKVALLQLAQQLGNVRQACKLSGYSRDSYYRFQKLYESGGEAALAHASRRKPLHKNRVGAHIEEAIVALAFEQPAFGPLRIVNELAKRQMVISAAGVRSVWQRHDLETRKKRLAALEARHKTEPALSDAQFQALEAQFASLIEEREPAGRH